MTEMPKGGIYSIEERTRSHLMLGVIASVQSASISSGMRLDAQVGRFLSDSKQFDEVIVALKVPSSQESRKTKSFDVVVRKGSFVTLYELRRGGNAHTDPYNPSEVPWWQKHMKDFSSAYPKFAVDFKLIINEPLSVSSQWEWAKNDLARGLNLTSYSEEFPGFDAEEMRGNLAEEKFVKNMQEHPELAEYISALIRRSLGS